MKITDGNEKKFKKNRHDPNDPTKFVRRTAITTDGKVAKEEYCQPNQAAIDKEAMYDGFHAATTDIEGNVSEIITINEKKWQIEECFRVIKTNFEARPVYLQRENRIKAHFLVCFLALLTYRILELKLDKKYTIESIIAILRRMDICALGTYGHILVYRRTDLIDDLHELFGLRTDTQVIERVRMRNIIRQSKIANQLLYSSAKPKTQD